MSESSGFRGHLLLQISSAGLGLLPYLSLKHIIFRDGEPPGLGQCNQLLQLQWLSKLLSQSRILMTRTKQLIEVLQGHSKRATKNDLHQRLIVYPFFSQQAGIIFNQLLADLSNHALTIKQPQS